LTENDIILEINGQKIDETNSLAKAVSRLKAGDEITLKVFSKGKEKNV
jgi:S1-C subfamily serine protease